MGRAHLDVRLAALGIASLGVTACGSPPYDHDEDVNQISSAAVCAAGPTVEGIDVSSYQDIVDWPAVAGDGIDFAIMRVSNGLTKDVQFDRNWSGSQSVGLVRGLYQYFRAGTDPIAQADLVIDAIGGSLGPNDLPPVIDVEATHNTGVSPSQWVSAIEAWVQRIESRLGVKPMLYSGCYYWPDNVGSSAYLDLPYWVPNYVASCPCMPTGYWPKWQFWQYTESGSVSGVAGNVDRDRFNGTLDQLRALAGGGGTSVPFYGAEYVSQSFPLTNDGPMALVAGQAATVSITLRNSGSMAWDHNTRLATTEPRDRVSPFAGAEWPAPNRYAAVSGNVPPGGEHTFTFQMHAPAQPGLYDEHFGLEQAGVGWFSDPGQGGPTDQQLEGLFDVQTSPGSGAAGGAGGSGTAGAGAYGNGGAPIAGCTALPDCGSCSNCFDICRCKGGSNETCAEMCFASPGSGGSASSAKPGDADSRSGCACRAAASRAPENTSLALLAAFACAVARRARKRRCRASERQR